MKPVSNFSVVSSTHVAFGDSTLWECQTCCRVCYRCVSVEGFSLAIRTGAYAVG